MCVYFCVCTCECEYMYMCTYGHTHLHICIEYICTYIRMKPAWNSLSEIKVNCGNGSPPSLVLAGCTARHSHRVSFAAGWCTELLRTQQRPPALHQSCLRGHAELRQTPGKSCRPLLPAGRSPGPQVLPSPQARALRGSRPGQDPSPASGSSLPGLSGSHKHLLWL